MSREEEFHKGYNPEHHENEDEQADQTHAPHQAAHHAAAHHVMHGCDLSDYLADRVDEDGQQRSSYDLGAPIRSPCRTTSRVKSKRGHHHPLQQRGETDVETEE